MSCNIKGLDIDPKDILEIEVKDTLFSSYIRITFKENIEGVNFHKLRRECFNNTRSKYHKK